MSIYITHRSAVVTRLSRGSIIYALCDVLDKGQGEDRWQWKEVQRSFWIGRKVTLVLMQFDGYGASGCGYGCGCGCGCGCLQVLNLVHSCTILDKYTYSYLIYSRCLEKGWFKPLLVRCFCVEISCSINELYNCYS